jgi:amino acid adenylation domain-containing protein
MSERSCGVSTLSDLLALSARRHPSRAAVVDPDGTRVSYAELDAQATRLAGHLRRVGVRPGDRVGIIVPKSARAVAALFGIMRAGAAYVPADYTAPRERNLAILRDCSVAAAFLTPDTADLLEGGQGPPVVVIGQGADAAVPRPRHACGFEEAAGSPVVEPLPEVGIDDLAYILYTSGSTGVPKGVMLTHRNALAFVDWCASVFEPVESDRFSSHAPFHFDLSVLDLYVSLQCGAELHLISDEVGKSPRELAAFIADRRLTVWYSTPSILSLLAQYGQLATRDYGALRLALFAGELFPVKHLRTLAALWPHPAYYNLYGPTETNVCTFARIPLPVPTDRAQPYPIGQPCAHYQDLVLDEAGRQVADGDEGLLYMSGPGVFQGYWNRPREDAAAFLERDGTRWYNTGDLVRWRGAEGYEFGGRRDRMVKRRGYRIELGEIERALYQHPQVAEAAAIASGEADGVRILVYLSVRDGIRPSIIDLKTFSASHLPGYMVPDAFQFMDALPRTSTDKVDYRGLADAGSAGSVA